MSWVAQEQQGGEEVKREFVNLCACTMAPIQNPQADYRFTEMMHSTQIIPVLTA
jgi:hypothetical protein